MAPKKSSRRRAHDKTSGSALPALHAVALAVGTALWLLQASPAPTADDEGGTGDSDSPRAAGARALLESLGAAGATLHQPVRLVETRRAGLGVYAARQIAAGEPIFSLPHQLMLLPDDRGDGVGLAAALLKQRRSPSTAPLRHYVASLPADCPANLAVAGEAELALARTSLHAWKVELLESELWYIDTHVPGALPTPVCWQTIDLR